MTINDLIKNAPVFAGYRIDLPSGHPCEGAVISGAALRPANLFFNALFKGTTISTTLPGSGQLFAFNTRHSVIRDFYHKKAILTPDAEVAFCAKGVISTVLDRQNRERTVDLGEIFGSHTYKISYKEIFDLLDSQKIFVSSLLPLPFYKGLKAAMLADHMVILPGNDHAPILLEELRATQTNMGAFLRQVKAEPMKFGFTSQKASEELFSMTLYQIGALVVKRENYQLFVDGNGKIIPRNPGERDAIRLINACGIRGIRSQKTDPKFNKKIMQAAFKTAFVAAGRGIVIFPAVGMGVWRGDPDLYWRAFFNAVLKAPDSIETIFVNPRHQVTPYGKYRGAHGEEFQRIFEEYCFRYKNVESKLDKLRKIYNLYDSQKDVLQLAHYLKKIYPEKIISLFNASDPDVTLGYHVGQYVNNRPHTTTTEENYTAMGSNGWCAEGITGVHQHPDRVVSVKL